MAEDVNKNKELAAALRRILTEGTFTSRDITLAADALDPPPKDEWPKVSMDDNGGWGVLWKEGGPYIFFDDNEDIARTCAAATEMRELLKELLAGYNRRSNSVALDFTSRVRGCLAKQEVKS